MATRPHTQGALSADRTPEVNYWHRHSLYWKHKAGQWRRYALRLKRQHARHSSTRSFYGTVAHRAGWLCIHSREGAWDSNTGNGYYGGLQMHLDWYGVHRADLLSPEQQMAAAERAYRQSGYSHSWLAGQWPNTYPPCAGLF